MQDGATPPGRRTPRAFRGLALVFLLSFVSLSGLVVTATAIGGLAPWSTWEFVGAFGVLEAAAGLANVISPNIWRLPVAAVQTSERTDVRLAASVLLLPHWGGLARCAAGVSCLALAAWQEAIGIAGLGLVPLVAAVAVAILAASAVLARAGVARPDLDVLQLVVRWGGRDRELAPVSIGASVLQFLLAIATIPAVKLLPPSVLYRPELGPSAGALLAAAGTAVGLSLLAWAAWSDRVGLAAPPEQQRESDEHA